MKAAQLQRASKKETNLTSAPEESEGATPAHLLTQVTVTSANKGKDVEPPPKSVAPETRPTRGPKSLTTSSGMVVPATTPHSREKANPPPATAKGDDMVARVIAKLKQDEREYVNRKDPLVPLTSEEIEELEPILEKTPTTEEVASVEEQLHCAKHLIRRLQREKEIALADNLWLKQGQLVFRELVSFAHRQPSQVALVLTHELEAMCDSTRWTLVNTGAADVIRLGVTVPCSHRRCTMEAQITCTGCNLAHCRLHIPCTDCSYFTPLPRPNEPLYPTDRERSQARAHGNTDEDLRSWNFTLRPRRGLRGETFAYHNFQYDKDHPATTAGRQVANWHKNIMALDTGPDSPPLARAFNYLKQVPGEWVLIREDKVYPFHAMRSAANPAFTISHCVREEEWRASMSYLLTWADIDEKNQAIAEVKTLFLTLQANNVPLSGVREVIWTLLEYLLPQPQKAHKRIPEGTDYQTGVWLSEEPRKLAGLPHYVQGGSPSGGRLQKDSSPNGELTTMSRRMKLDARPYRWLVQYYQCDRPGVGPIYSYAPPLAPADRKAIYEEITEALSFPDLPSIASAPAPINETSTVFWNPRDPECPNCFHNVHTCDRRCSNCRTDKEMLKKFQKHGRMTQHQRNRSGNIQRERDRRQARRLPQHTLGNHATAYQGTEQRRSRYNKH